MINLKISKSNKCNGEYSVYASFPYDTKVVNLIREFPSRYWDSTKKEWEFPYKNLSTFVENLKEYEFDIVGDNFEMTVPKKEVKVPDNFKFKTKPFEHQIEGFNYGLQYDNWLLGDEQGLGKTKQVIDIAVAKKLQKGYKHCLIICGVNGLKWNWLNEIHTHSDEEGWILGQRLKKNKIVVGSTEDKISDLDALNDDYPYFLITNVESLRDERIVSKIANRCVKGDIGLVAADEIHKCFDGDTEICTSVGKMKIKDIVINKLPVKVLSYNETTQQYEWKQIIDWFENPITERMIELQIETSTGVKTIKCTDTHKFYTTNRGWVCAKDLTEFDDIVENNA